ncbi:SGNH hydrolase [Ceraceosorus guamensis]|uniref:SGNH hydrolase n=1 Tax=Ceraceosorus guamensis TaxID=1522189 RepID=A0A316W1K0_9BASI|nr:SGNH hydrolase [Ceraceosorus guamensis]PWN43384.1 SGNH hydrolase [Ceraceosorus guamensis]
MASRIYDQIILFGDSQFEHGDLLVGLLQTAYQHKLEVVKRGFSGYTTREARAIVPHVFQQSDQREVGGKAALVVVWFGTNDAKLKGTSQHRPVSEFEDNMKAMLQEIEERCGAGVPILVLTPAPCLDSLSVPSKHNITAASQEISGAGVKLVAGLSKSNVKPVEMMRMLDDAKKRFNGLHDYIVEDGLHIRPEGYHVSRGT